MGNNWKAVCIDGTGTLWIKGDIIEVKNGIVAKCSDMRCIEKLAIKSFEEWNNFSTAKWEEIEEISKIYELFSNEPVIEFKDSKQAYEYLNWWKEKLFLQNWIISISNHDHIIVDGIKLEVSGHIDFEITKMSAHIKLVNKNDDNSDRIVKFCQEESLVHELLHLKYNWVNVNADEYEKSYFDTLEHQLISQMAMSLIMVKYGIDYSWFKNFEEQ